MSPNPPEVVDRYQILQPIGQGGMGTIYLARDPRIGNRHVVIKLLREGFDNAELRERFSREADAAGGLHHVNIVTIFDVGEFDGQPFIAMEYIQGETLTDLIQRRAPLSLGRKLQLMEELCAGLRYAHRAGIIHRDIKPANIMVDQDGVLKILDFGIARLGTGGMTRAGMVMGTLNYMAPEQMAGQPVDARADIFSAGAVFYELLSYQRAFPGDLPGIVHKIMTATREPLNKLVPDLDPAVVSIVDRCLARDLPDRYQDMAAVRKDLATLRQRIVYDEQRSVDTYMGEAQTAMAQADFQRVIEVCQHVLAVDSEYQPAIELQQQARAQLDAHQVRGWLAQANVEIDRGAMTAASALVERALGVTVSSSSPELGTVRQAIEDAQRRIADARARNAELAQALAHAQQHLNAGALDLALQQIDAALGLDGANVEAKGLKEQIVAAIAARKRAEEQARQQREQAEQEARARAAATIQVERTLRFEPEPAPQPEPVRPPEPVRQPEQVRPSQPAPQPLVAPAPTLRIDRGPVREKPPVREQEPVPATRGNTPLLVGAGIMLAAIIGIWFWVGRTPTPVSTAPSAETPTLPETPPAAIPAASTSVVFDFAPWANIDAIVRKDTGQSMAAGAALVTPCIVPLAPGEYHVRASNPNFSRLEFDLTVQSGNSQIVRREMPGFDPQREIASIVDR